MTSLARIFEALFDRVMRRSKTFLFVVAVVFALLVSALPQLRTELRIFEIMDPAFPSTERLDQMKTEFNDGNSAIFIFASRNANAPLTYQQFCAIQSWVHQERFKNHDLKSVFSPFGFRRPTLDGEKLWYKQILNVDCQTKAQSQAPAVELGELLKTPWAKVMTNPSLSDLAVEFIYADADKPNRFGSFDPSVIGATLARAQAALEQDSSLGLKVYLTGKAAPQYQFMKAMERDSLVNLAVIVLCLLLFRLFFGTWTSGLLFVFAISGSLLAVLGCMARLGIPLDMLGSNLFLLLCVAGIADSLFICQAQADGAKDWRRSYRELMLPGFLTSLTTFIGFISLTTSDLHIIQRFGLATALGTIAEWFATFFVLPAICSLFPKNYRFVVPERSWRPTGLTQLASFTPHRTVRSLALVAAAASCLGWFFLTYEDNINENFPKGHLHRETFAYTKQTRAWEGIMQVVFPSSMTANEVEQTISEISRDPKVFWAESPFSMMPYYTQGLAPGLAAMVEREVGTTPVIERYISASGDSRATIYLSEFNLSAINAVSQRADQLCKDKGCYPAGEGVVYAEFSSTMVTTMLDSFLLSVGLVSAVLYLISLGLPFLTRVKLIITSLWGPLVMIGIMAAFKVPVNQATSLFAAILVGMTGDNAIQYICAGRRGNLSLGIQKRAVASLKLSFVLCTLSLSFLFLTLIPMRLLGGLFFTGFALTVMGDLWLLKGFLEPDVSKPPPIAGADVAG